ncbi:hypothetical protein SynBOUM118_00469 [Synechococcus sp. BOUM118]|nr:hypothetical protein SynBOUM118_00469 [Synechococcus sp. BOUM118]
MNQAMAHNHHHNGVISVHGQQTWQARFEADHERLRQRVSLSSSAGSP